jgi:hypothetical protein
MTDQTPLTERARIVAHIRRDAAAREREFARAREHGDDAAMDRCAARARTASRLADEIERGDYE